jgi:hypothetical protein
MAAFAARTPLSRGPAISTHWRAFFLCRIGSGNVAASPGVLVRDVEIRRRRFAMPRSACRFAPWRG